MGTTQRIPGSFIDGTSPSGMPRKVKLKFAMLSVTPELMPFERRDGSYLIDMVDNKKLDSLLTCLCVIFSESLCYFCQRIDCCIIDRSAHLRG